MLLRATRRLAPTLRLRSWPVSYSIGHSILDTLCR